MNIPSKKREILLLIVSGLTNKEVASRVGLSVKTIDKDKTWLYQYLAVHNTIQLLRKALQTGLVDYEMWLSNKPIILTQTPPKPAAPNSQQNRFDPTSLGLSI